MSNKHKKPTRTTEESTESPCSVFTFRWVTGSCCSFASNRITDDRMRTDQSSVSWFMSILQLKPLCLDVEFTVTPCISISYTQWWDVTKYIYSVLQYKHFLGGISATHHSSPLHLHGEAESFSYFAYSALYNDTWINKLMMKYCYTWSSSCIHVISDGSKDIMLHESRAVTNHFCNEWLASQFLFLSLTNSTTIQWNKLVNIFL